MTSRLKHKLELDQINTKSAYLNESFVKFGTPLPALADTRKDKLEYVPEWKQEVRDEQGRRRFHGAFTGGYSAGYYNSVGSKEGWAPSTFKSSRSNRAQKTQRPEDFMDEEDIQQMRDDRQLENTDTFQDDAFAGSRKPAGENLPSLLESLIAPTQSSIGQKLLQKLGWRPGQGIGPRVTLRKLRLQEGKLGKARLGVQDDREELGEEAGKHTFAPRDVKLLVYGSKEDKHGLGFEKGKGIARLRKSARSCAYSKLTRFGLAGPTGPRYMDEDEDDPYGADPAKSSASRLAFEHGEEDDDVIVMGASSERPGLGLGAPRRDKNAAGNDDRWHDGRPVLVGFMLDPKGVPQDPWFPFPEIPSDWRPRPARVWGTTRKWDELPGQKVEKDESIRGVPGRPLTHEQRGIALGEEMRIAQARSVFDYLSQKDRERLASVEGAKSVPPPPLSLEPESEVAPRLSETEVELPPLSPRTASAALQGFIPYGDDPVKQERYKSYLLSQTHNTKQPNPDLLPSSSIGDINKELQGFASSARIFKPMSFAMSSRFTSGSSTLAASDLKQARPGLHIYDAEKAKEEMEKPKGVEKVRMTKNMTPREQAASVGTYGKLTRETKRWYPVKLLCKRFGVQDPHPDGKPADADETSTRGSGADSLPALPANDASWESKFIYKEPEAPASSTTAQNAPPPPTGDRVPKSLAEVGMADDINQGRDTLTYTKPSIDIFKAIFADDDEDEVDDELGAEDGGQTSVAVVEPAEVYKDPFPPKDEGPVDLATFKPVFAKRKDDDRSREGKKEKKKDKDKNKKRKGVLSFDVGEEGEDIDRDRDRDDRKKRKTKEKNRTSRDADDDKEREKKQGDQDREREEEELEGEWVEKPAIIPRLAARMGAADYM